MCFSLSPAPSEAHRIMGNQIPRGPPNSRCSKKGKGISTAFCPGDELHLLELCVLCPCNPFYSKDTREYLNSISSFHFSTPPYFRVGPMRTQVTDQTPNVMCVFAAQQEMILEGKFPPLWERFFPALERMVEPGMI